MNQVRCFCLLPLSSSTSDLLVYLGRESQEGVNANEVSRQVAQVIRHEGYDSTTNDNDIALLQLSSPVEFTSYIRPVCLAAQGSSFDAGTSCWVTGWGTINSGGETSLSLFYQQTLT